MHDVHIKKYYRNISYLMIFLPLYLKNTEILKNTLGQVKYAQIYMMSDFTHDQLRGQEVLQGG